MVLYNPGVCNIGKNEIRKRYLLGLVGFLVAIVFVYFLRGSFWVWLSFFPFMAGFEGAYQGYFKFCAGFARAGIYDFEGSGGKRGKVGSTVGHLKDLVMARKIHIYSFVSSVVLTILVWLAFG